LQRASGQTPSGPVNIEWLPALISVDLLACFSNPAPGLLELYRKVCDLAQQQVGDDVTT